MISYKESLKILKETKALLEGHFILSSGLHSRQYVQCAQLLSKPSMASKICISLSEKIKDKFNKIDLILAPAMGGIIIGYEIGRLLNKETIFSERVKGSFLLRRDFVIPKNSNVLIVEDVITTGKSSIECSKLITQSQANILGYACIIDRSSGKYEIKGTIVSEIKLEIPTYNKNNIHEDIKLIKEIKQDRRAI